LDSLSREGRRNVSTVLDAQLIKQVMGEPAAEPIRVYVGLESAPTEYERRDLVQSLNATAYLAARFVVQAASDSTARQRPSVSGTLKAI